jgi:hypothetical protein
MADTMHATAPVAAAGSPVRPAWRWSLLVVLFALAVRVWVDWYAIHNAPPYQFAGPSWVQLWFRYDATVYGLIAAEGYHPASVSPGDAACFSRFPPLLPMLSRGLWTLTGMPPSWCATVISIAASLVGSVAMLHWVTLAAGSVAVGLWAVAFLNLFPTSFLLATPNSEGLFVAAACLAVLGLRSRRWAMAGLAGGAAVLTRTLGVALLPAFAWSAWQLWRSGDLRRRPLLWLAVPFLAMGGLTVFHWWSFGSPFNQVQAYTRWPLAMVPRFPFFDIWDDLRTMVEAWLDGQLNEGIMLRVGWDGLHALAALGLIGWGSRKGWLTNAEALAGFCYIAVFSTYMWNFSSTRYLSALPMLPLVLARLPLLLRVPLLLASAWSLPYCIRMFLCGFCAF